MEEIGVVEEVHHGVVRNAILGLGIQRKHIGNGAAGGGNLRVHLVAIHLDKKKKKKREFQEDQTWERKESKGKRKRG